MANRRRLTRVVVTFFAVVIGIRSASGQEANVAPVSGGVFANHGVTLSFAGPETSEAADPNPFTDYRLSVTFQQGGQATTVRGFYAADGNAAHTGAKQGRIWQVRFAPDRPGRWQYTASLRAAKDIAVSDDPSMGMAVALTNATGSFEVDETESRDQRNRDLRNQGRLKADGHYFRLGPHGPHILKVGANSPENLLAYVEFDDTFRLAVNDREGEAKAAETIHRYGDHQRDWRDGDPSWRDGKGKSLIGAVNYLASTGMNCVYFLTMNIDGDGKDVWPYAAPDDFTRFDCSKLDQWNVVFEHMQRQGLILHVITQETENEKLLDRGDVGRHRQLYYRELIARFAHHSAIIWNLGEENGPAEFSPNGQTTTQQKAMADFFKDHDPYGNTVLIHTHSTKKHQEPIVSRLLGHQSLSGLSLQVANPKDVNPWIAEWRRRSAAAGHPWAISMDEIGPANVGVLPDNDDPLHDEMRGQVLWGGLLGGASGVEWYFGYRHAHNDLGCEDWRSRDSIWRQTKIACDFFQTHLPYASMEPASDAVGGGRAYCLAAHGTVYAIYRDGRQPDAEITLDLSQQPGPFQVHWFNPREGGRLQRSTRISGGRRVQIGMPPASPGKDWVALVKNE